MRKTSLVLAVPLAVAGICIMLWPVFTGHRLQNNWIMNIPMMYFCDFCVDCKIADRTLLSQKRETTSQRVK